MHPIIILMCTFSLITLLISVVLTFKKTSRKWLLVFSWLAAVIQLAMLGGTLFSVSGPKPNFPEKESTTVSTEASPQAESTGTAAVTTPAPTDPRNNFHVQASENADPSLFEITWEIGVNDQVTDQYSREDPVCFELDREYFALPGISTFRGNPYRCDSSYGMAQIENETMDVVWNHRIGYLNKWGGCAWTGQPLVVQWDDETKSIMTTMYEAKRQKDGLVEVIYATLDGYIHFYDLEDGSKTRDPISMGMNFKGAGALDPRGYPLLYVGAGLYINGAAPRMFVVNLITGKIIYQYGNSDAFALRDWSAFDASPLVDAETDTLVWPGENGVLYTIKLNTQYDPQAGTVSVNPDTPVKTRYSSRYSRDLGRYQGYEASPVIVDHYLYASENSGLLHCVDLNTMELVWAQDLGDDADSTSVFEWSEAGKGYLYTASSLHWTAEDNKGTASIYKLDAATGEILWRYERNCERYDDIAGGVMSSPVLGRENTDIDGLIIYAIGRTPTAYRGVLVALDKDTGEKIWEISTGNYVWSSPVAIYNDNGDAYIFLVNASGLARLIDGSTGEILDTLDFGETVEASAVAFGNMLVIGSRVGVYGIRIS